jgi:transposase InsO family protein
MNTRRVIRSNISYIPQANLEDSIGINIDSSEQEAKQITVDNSLEMSLSVDQLLETMRILKPEIGTMPTFNGKPSGLSPEDYINKIRKYGLMNKLSEEEQWQRAVVSLSGTAETWFETLPEDHAANQGWTNFKHALIERFSTAGDDQTNHQLFLNRKMKATETFDEFSEAVDKLLKVIRDKSMIPENAVVSTMSGNLIPKYKNLIAIRDKHLKPKSREELAGLVKNYEQAYKTETSTTAAKTKEKSDLEINNSTSIGRGAKDVSNITCFLCKEQGHYQSNCPNLKGGEPSTNMFKPRSGMCYICQSKDHWANLCPQRTNQTSASSTTPAVKEEKKVRVVNNNSEDFNVVIHVGDVRVKAVIDSGAEIHCMSEQFYKRLDNKLFPLNIEKNLDRFRHATGKLECIGVVDVPVEINNSGVVNTETYQFYVMMNLIDPILIGKHSISSVQLNSGLIIQNGNKQNNVRLLQAVSIGAQSCRTVKVVADEIPNERELIIEPAQLKQGIVTRSISNEDNMVTTIFNPTDVAIHIPKEEVIGSIDKISSSGTVDTAKMLVDYPDDKQVDITKIPGYSYVRNIIIEDELDGETAVEAEVKQVEGIPEILRQQVDSNLTEEQRKQLQSLLMQYPTVFAANTKAPSFTSKVEHIIDTGDAAPIKQRSYRTSHAEQVIQSKEIEEMLQNGIIRKSNSEWSSPVVMVTKKDGSVRFCIDYRRVNEVTRKDSYPLPRISEVLDVLQGAKYFSTIDFASGYWQIKVRDEDVGKTAFVSRDGLFEFVRMPFGLANAPATFQRTMDVLLTGLNWKICLVYIDDIMVFSSSFEEHLEHLREVFERLKAANFTIKLSKCYFGKSEAQYLGHIVSRDGVKPDPSKIAAVENFSVPQTLTDVRSFLGIVNYYHRFVPDLGTLAEPLYYLMKKNVHFNWNEQCQAAFEKIKVLLVSSPTLRFPDFTREFIICCDASDCGLGVILSQVDEDGKEYVVSYGSRALSKEEKNYSVSERECLSVIFGVTSFRCYLHGRHFTVFTDHGSLQWLLNLKDANGRLARWALKLQGHDMTIHHRAGRLNGNADALSRAPVPIRVVTRSKHREQPLAMSNEHDNGDQEEKKTDSSLDLNIEENTTAIQVEPEQKQNPIQSEPLILEPVPNEKLLEKFYNGQQSDTDLKLIYNYLKLKHLPEDINEAARVRVISSSFMLQNDLLYHIWYPTNVSQRMDVRKQLVVPIGMRQEIMISCHDTYDGGHFGADKTYRKLRDRFYWSTMYQDCEAYCKSCPICQARKIPRRQREAALLGTPIADHAFERIGVDVIGPLPKTKNGNKYIVTFTDSFTRWVEAYAVPEQKEETIAELLVCEIVCRFGAPKYLVSDRGSNFLSALCTKVYELMKIKKVTTTSYHPQSNGIVERFNGVLVQMLAMYSKENDWDSYIPYLLSAYRSCYNSTIQETPFMMTFGRQMILPIDAMLNTGEAYSTDRSDYADEIAYRLNDAHKRAKQLLNDISLKRNKKNIELINQKEFNVGDMVMLRCALKKGVNRKLNKFNWLGPYRVVERLSLVNYRLDIPTPSSGNKPHDIVHVDRLKQWFDANATSVVLNARQ